MRFSLRALACSLFGLTTGCSGGGSATFSPNGAPLASYVADATYDGTNSGGVYDVSQCTSLSPSADTGWTHFDETFGTGSGAQTVYGKVPYWPKNSTISLYVNGSGSSTFSQAANAAVNTWNSTLRARAPGTLNLTLNVSNSALNNSGFIALGTPINSPISEVDTGAFTARSIDSTGMSYTNANITVFDNGTDGMDQYTYWYNTVLHETGHALGLTHNSDQQSVMYYADRSRFNYSATCYTSGRVPSTADTDNLENYYDPVFMGNPGGGDGTVCKGKNCYMSHGRAVANTRRVESVNQDGSFVVKGTYVDPSEEGGKRVNETWNSGHPVSGTWERTFENAAAYDVSSESLVLSSTLVAQVTAGKSIQRVVYGNQHYVLTPVRIVSILKSVTGPDKDRRPSDTIMVAEPVPVDWTQYVDEPSMAPGECPMIFLQRDPQWVLRGSAGDHVYHLTYPMVSKWYVSRDRRLHVAGLLNTRVAREVDSMSGPALGVQAVRRYGPGAILSESALVSAILRRRGGGGSTAELSRYHSSLSTNPREVASRNRAYDALHRDPIDY